LGFSYRLDSTDLEPYCANDLSPMEMKTETKVLSDVPDDHVLTFIPGLGTTAAVKRKPLPLTGEIQPGFDRFSGALSHSRYDLSSPTEGSRPYDDDAWQSKKAAWPLHGTDLEERGSISEQHARPEHTATSDSLMPEEGLRAEASVIQARQTLPEPHRQPTYMGNSKSGYGTQKQDRLLEYERLRQDSAYKADLPEFFQDENGVIAAEEKARDHSIHAWASSLKTNGEVAVEQKFRDQSIRAWAVSLKTTISAWTEKDVSWLWDWLTGEPTGEDGGTDSSVELCSREASTRQHSDFIPVIRKIVKTPRRKGGGRKRRRRLRTCNASINQRVQGLGLGHSTTSPRKDWGTGSERVPIQTDHLSLGMHDQKDLSNRQCHNLSGDRVQIVYLQHSPRGHLL